MMGSISLMEAASSPRILSLRYDGVCAVCSSLLARRTRTWWFREEKRIVCFACRPEQPGVVCEQGETDGPESQEPSQVSVTLTVEVAIRPLQPLLADGKAGASARREGERRRARREQRTLERHPRLGRLILAVSEDSRMGKGSGWRGNWARR